MDAAKSSCNHTTCANLGDEAFLGLESGKGTRYFTTVGYTSTVFLRCKRTRQFIVTIVKCVFIISAQKSSVKFCKSQHVPEYA